MIQSGLSDIIMIRLIYKIEYTLNTHTVYCIVYIILYNKLYCAIHFWIGIKQVISCLYCYLTSYQNHVLRAAPVYCYDSNVIYHI